MCSSIVDVLQWGGGGAHGRIASNKAAAMVLVKNVSLIGFSHGLSGFQTSFLTRNKNLNHERKLTVECPPRVLRPPPKRNSSRDDRTGPPFPRTELNDVVVSA